MKRSARLLSFCLLGLSLSLSALAGPHRGSGSRPYHGGGHRATPHGGLTQGRTEDPVTKAAISGVPAAYAITGATSDT
jgi:hypothetical protein